MVLKPPAENTLIKNFYVQQSHVQINEAQICSYTGFLRLCHINLPTIKKQRHHFVHSSGVLMVNYPYRILDCQFNVNYFFLKEYSLRPLYKKLLRLIYKVDKIIYFIDFVRRSYFSKAKFILQRKMDNKRPLDFQFQGLLCYFWILMTFHILFLLNSSDTHQKILSMLLKIIFTQIPL